MADTQPGATGYSTGFLLSVVHRLARKTFAESLTGLGIDPPHFGVLMQLACREPLS